MLKNLPKIADIHYGKYSKTLENGETKYLNVSHFDEFGKLTLFNDSYIERDVKNMKFVLRENDVILAAKGNRNFAWAYKEEYGECIPSSAFFLMRVNSDEVIAEYLAYYLNTDKMQYLIKSMVTGGTMPSIPKKEFLELNIAVPSLEEQKRIIEFAKLIDEDIELTNQLLAAKQKLKKGLLDKLIMNQK